MPSFGDIQFKTRCDPTTRTRLRSSGSRDVKCCSIGRRRTDSHEREQTKDDNRLASRTCAGCRAHASAARPRCRNSTHHAPRPWRVLCPDFGQFDLRARRCEDFAIRQTVALSSIAPGRPRRGRRSCIACRVPGGMTGVKPPEWWRGIGPSTWGEMVEYSAGGRSTRGSSGRRPASGCRAARAGRVVTIEPGVRLDWNSFTGESAWQPRLRVTARFGETTAWAGFSAQAQTPSHESLQGFDYFHSRGRRRGAGPA